MKTLRIYSGSKSLLIGNAEGEFTTWLADYLNDRLISQHNINAVMNRFDKRVDTLEVFRSELQEFLWEARGSAVTTHVE